MADAVQQPFDGILRWQVPSDSEIDPHLVDLGAYEGRGECSCMDWRTRHGPHVKIGAHTECKHVARAERLLGRWVYARLGIAPSDDRDAEALGHWMRLHLVEHHEKDAQA